MPGPMLGVLPTTMGFLGLGNVGMCQGASAYSPISSHGEVLPL